MPAGAAGARRISSAIRSRVSQGSMISSAEPDRMDRGGNAFPARVSRCARRPDAIRPSREVSGRLIRGNHVQSM